MNTREVAQTINNGDFYDNIVPSNKGIANSFADLANRMISERRHSEDPSGLKSLIEKHAPQFRVYQQQDAHEFMRHLMDLLHEDTNKRAADKAKVVNTRELEDINMKIFPKVSLSSFPLNEDVKEWFSLCYIVPAMGDITSQWRQ